MSKQPSEKTQLANERRHNKRLLNEMQAAVRERDSYRIRATKAEQEAAEWKKRFDLLLARTPQVYIHTGVPMTIYGKALQAFQASDEFKQWAEPITPSLDPKVQRTLLQNRLIEAFESGWNAHSAPNGTVTGESE